ncbi:MAG: hypothetical protein BWY89_00654 [Bacteroidetes bacterium ADurb.BinA012]|nr:MAG: hypothetical protein BWY89_00654 [Bacteroidetes bacterium ADurb.BinA012]
MPFRYAGLGRHHPQNIPAINLCMGEINLSRVIEGMVYFLIQSVGIFIAHAGRTVPEADRIQRHRGHKPEIPVSLNQPGKHLRKP